MTSQFSLMNLNLHIIYNKNNVLWIVFNKFFIINME